MVSNISRSISLYGKACVVSYLRESESESERKRARASERARERQREREREGERDRERGVVSYHPMWYHTCVCVCVCVCVRARARARNLLLGHSLPGLGPLPFQNEDRSFLCPARMHVHANFSVCARMHVC